MIREVRFFLFHQLPGEAIDVEAFRDAPSARERWLQYIQISAEARGILFAGSARPGIQDVESILPAWNGLLLISESCKWLLPPGWTTVDYPVEGIQSSAHYPEMPLFVGKDGWGYPEIKAIEFLRQFQPNEFQEARSTGDSLSQDQEGFLAALAVMGEDDPFLIARHLPEWAVGATFDLLPLTVRCRNVLQKQRVVRLPDLARFTREESMQWQNFGRHSLKDLADALVLFLREGPSQLAPQAELPSALELPDLLECIRKSTKVMSDREASVWKARIGLDGPKMTLEQLATVHGVTRERIRQIEAKTLRNYRQSNRWIEAVGPRVNQALEQCDSALFIEDLEHRDPWFSGLSEQPAILGTLCEYFGPPDIFIWSSEGRPLVTKIEQAQWLATKQTILASLRSMTGRETVPEDVELTVRSVLGGVAPGMTSLMLKELGPYLRFSDGEGENCRLLSVGRGLTAEIRAIIQDARTPLHYSEVVAECEASLGRTVNQQQVINTLAAFDDTLHFGPGTYGLTKHFPLSASDTSHILALANEIILTDPNLRQWHTDEVLEEISHLDQRFSSMLDKYLLNIILGKSDQIVPMGRMVWVAKRFEGDIPRQRIEIQDACIRLLRDANRPLDNRELRDQLTPIRGMSPFLMLSPNAEIARVAPGVWGLINRDFHSTLEERKALLQRLFGALTKRQMPIHMDDLNSNVYLNDPLPPGMTPYMVMNLAQADERMHVYRGRFIGLHGWDALIPEDFAETPSASHLALDFDEPDTPLLPS